MDQLDKKTNSVESSSKEILDKLSAISEKAIVQLEEAIPASAATLAIANTFNDPTAASSVNKASAKVRESAYVLKDEPALARVLVEDEDGKRDIFYICRISPIDGIRNLASYDSPIGRLAAIRIGAEFTLPNGRTVEVLERFVIHPHRDASGWDSEDTVLESGSDRRRTFRSLRLLLANLVDESESEDPIAQLLADEQAAANVIEGTRRKLITRMALRDQYILNEFQDEIFRLPLKSSLLLLGPPGTGKTTTLVKRLSQKIKPENLTDSDALAVERTLHAGTDHASSWIMFTPTELLKLYLKEVFASQSVGATANHLQTWDQFRRDLARNVFAILRSNASAGGIYSLRLEAPILRQGTQENCVDWFEDFYAWQHQAFTKQLRDAAEKMASSETAEARSIAALAMSVLNSADGRSLSNLLGSLTDYSDRLSAFVSAIRKETEDAIRKTLNAQYKRAPTLLRDLAEFTNTLGSVQDSDGADDADSDGDEEEEDTVARSDIEAAVVTFNRATRSFARAMALKRSIPKTSKNARVIEWLKERDVDFGDVQGIGQKLLTLQSARLLNQPVRRYFNDLPKRYRLFRRQRVSDARWYEDAIDQREIGPFEIDVIILALLSAAQSAADRGSLAHLLTLPAWAPLRAIADLWRNQVLVDEATDFSPIQLRCMAGLCPPNLKSFFACGDFNQRLTPWGARTASEFSWVSKEIELREVTIGYRQSKQLNKFACALIEEKGGNPPDVKLPDHVDNDGVPPLLLENAITQDACALWLADRICEIERSLDQLPSIAIFVNSENDVEPFAHLLRERLEPYHINVTAAVRGEILGQVGDVRVFDIRHIKGLEFEAAFFVGVDDLAAQHADLIDNYLYVGVTRAATYLGLLSFGEAPKLVQSLRDHFGTNWST